MAYFLLLIFVVQCFAQLQLSITNPYPGLNSWTFATTLGSQHVLAGIDAPAVASASDLQQWSISSPNQGNLLNLCSTKNLIVAITAQNNAYTAFVSFDGLTWNNGSPLPVVATTLVACSEDQIVVLDQESSKAWRSIDGETWKEFPIQDAPFTVWSSFKFVCNTYIGWLSSDPTTAFYSPDLLTWKQFPSPFETINNIFDVACNEDMIFISTPSIYATKYPFSSSKPTWEVQVPSLSQTGYSLFYQSGKLFALNSTSVLTPGNNMVWNEILNNPFSPLNLQTLLYDSKYGAIVGGDNGLAIYSSDLKNWGSPSFTLNGLSWVVSIPSTGKFLALDTSNLFESSDCGSSWSLVPLSSDNIELLNGTVTMQYFESIKMFVGYRLDPASGNVSGAVVSPDGREWTLSLDVKKMYLPGLEQNSFASNGTGVFAVSCAPRYFACLLFYTSDGMNWNYISSPLIPGGIFASSNGLLIGAGLDQLFVSNNGGIEWSSIGVISQCGSSGYQFYEIGDRILAVTLYCALSLDKTNLTAGWTNIRFQLIESLDGFTLGDNLVLINDANLANFGYATTTDGLNFNYFSGFNYPNQLISITGSASNGQCAIIVGAYGLVAQVTLSV